MFAVADTPVVIFFLGVIFDLFFLILFNLPILLKKSNWKASF